MKDINVLEKAKKHGYYSLVILLISYAAQAYLGYKFPEETLWFSVVTAIGMIIVLYTYRTMMLGILAMAEESTDQNFILSTKSFIKTTIISCLVIAFVMVVFELISTELVAFVSFISIVAMLVYLGMASLKISKGFTALEEKYAKTAKRAVFWHKITGYLLVSVILSIIGMITSLVADYFMWRLICMRLKESKTSN